MADLPFEEVLKIVKKTGVAQIDDEAVYAIIKKTEEYIADCTREGIRLASHAGRITIKAEDLELAAAIAPINKPSDIQNILRGEYGDFPLYGFFLFSTFDQDIINFVNDHASWLQNSSGEDILLALFENPEKWGRGWKEYWKQKLGPGFDEKYAEWSVLLPEDRDLAYSIADLLGVGKNILPCIVFVKSFEDKQILCIPLIQNRDNFRFYFEDLFTVIQEVKMIPAEDRFIAFQKKWKMVWAKWILPEKIKTYTKAIQEWGSLIIETKNTILSIIEPITPFIAPIRGIISK